MTPPAPGSSLIARLRQRIAQDGLDDDADHSEATRSTAFILPVHGTSPELLVALGQRSDLADLLINQPGQIDS